MTPVELVNQGYGEAVISKMAAFATHVGAALYPPTGYLFMVLQWGHWKHHV